MLMMLTPCKVERIVAEKNVAASKSGSKKSTKFYFIKWVRFVHWEIMCNDDKCHHEDYVICVFLHAAARSF